ncbi:uncharacterized protein C4orf50 homolog isoform X3 [Cuculus canorus]|uniref:uncharacterized protein C4orf50 homolog isoform X3 n=1 Tax=Cuculus canorus TaxID=55661 RepID=UPI0023AA3BF0|nr:uncharacterized protein C4orf50 homolog isoform X3 [Cuculus canorus]
MKEQKLRSLIHLAKKHSSHIHSFAHHCFEVAQTWDDQSIWLQQYVHCRDRRWSCYKAEKELEDASRPDGQVNSAGEENLNLRIKELENSEQKLKGTLELDSFLRNRMKELELSHRTILVMIDQLNGKLQRVENANLRVKGKLQDIQEDLVNLVENLEKSERRKKEKLHWLQEQLKTKGDEIKSQSEYFEHYKQRQRQQTAALRQRECSLQSEVSRLEKQVLDLNAHIALLTSKLEEGMVQYLQGKLESAFSGTGVSKCCDVEVTELKTCIENMEQDVKSHLDAFQQNLKLLREKEEDKRRKQADLLTELQCSQDSEDFLRRKLEESCHHVYNLKLSEIKLQEKVEDLLNENRALKDQGRARLKKKKRKDSKHTVLQIGDNSVDTNGELVQDDVQNLKWGAVLDPLTSRATQTPVVLPCAKESVVQCFTIAETPGCSCDGLKRMEELTDKLLPILEHKSGAFAKIAGLAEIEQQVVIGTKRTSVLEDIFILVRCTPSHPAAELLPPCSEKLTKYETSKETTDETNSSLLNKQAINLLAKTFPVSMVEVLMRNKPQLTLLEPEGYHLLAVTTVKEVGDSEANTSRHSDDFCLVAQGGISDKASVLSCGKMPCTVTENITSSLEKCNMEIHWENNKNLPKSMSEYKCLDKVVDDGKYHQKTFRGRPYREEIQNEKAQLQEVTNIPEESSKALNITKLIMPVKQRMKATDSLGSPQEVQNLSVGFKDLKKHCEGNPELMERHGNHLEICISDVIRVHNGEDVIKMEEKGEQAQKPIRQTKPSNNIGLKEKKDQTLKLHEPNNHSSCQKTAAENTHDAYSHKFFWSEERTNWLNILSPVQERVVCLSKLFLPGTNFYKCFCHLLQLEAGNELNEKIYALEKAMTLYPQRIFLLTQENKKYPKNLCILQQENERDAQMMCGLEEEMDAFFQYALTVDKAKIFSFQNLLNEKEVAGGCYNNFSEENTMSPGTFFVETFSKNFSCIKEKNGNSEKDSLTIASNKLPRRHLSLDGRKMRYFQLLSDLQEERSRCLKEIAKLLQEKKNYVAKYNELIQEREKNLQKISLLEVEKETLSGCLAEVKCERDKYKTLVSELQECKTSCYQSISDLQEKKCKLKRGIKMEETSEQLDEFQKANTNFILENSNWKGLMSSLGFTSEELRKDESLRTKEKIVKLKEESQQRGLKPKNVEKACSLTQTEEAGVLVINPSNYFAGKEGGTFESYSMMKKQVEKAKEELKIQQKELEKSKKEAQKWYRELGIAEARYEETKTRLAQALSELDQQEVGNKILGKQHCKIMPVYTVKDGQEIEENKIAYKRLQQQVLTMKAQLRDQAALQNRFHDLQNEVELLQTQLCEKEKELQKRKSEAELMLAPLKAKLACLTRMCQERNSFITRMLGEFHRRGIINSAFDEEVKNLVNDMVLAEYSVTFTPMCDQEMQSSSTKISQANGQPEDHETYVKMNGMTKPIPAKSQQEVDSIPSSHFIPNMYVTSPIKLTSPGRIIALHQELRQNHHKNCQIPSVVSSNSNLKADCNLPVIHEEAPWPLLSRMKNAPVPPERSAFWATKERDQLSKCDDVFWGQIGNQHAGAIPQGMKQKNAIMNKAWLSREKTDGSTSATTAKSYLSDVLSASNKG